MKIIFLINSSFPNYAGGIETWLYNVSHRLSEDYEITIISKRHKDNSNFFPKINNRINVEKYSSLSTFKFLRPLIRSYFRLFDYYISSKNMGAKLKKIIDKEDICYIVALDSLFCVRPALKAIRKNKNAKLVSSLRCPHGELWGKDFPLLKKIILGLESKYLNQVDAIWSNGYDTIEIYNKRGFSSSLMRNGVDFKKLSNIAEVNHRDKDSLRIVSIGTLLPIKGIFELIEALNILVNKNNYDVDLYFIGKGDKTKYQEFAKDKKIAHKVHFLGHQNNPIKYLSGKSIAACLSGGSGMGMAAIEAMSSGKPIIAWNSPVYQQFNRQQQTMYLVEEKNIKELVNGLKEISNNYDHYCKTIVENARTEAKNYDWEIVCNDLLTNLSKI